MNKIILEEDDLLSPEDNQVEEVAMNSVVTSSMTELIKKVWELIDTLNETSINLTALGNENINSIIKDIVGDEYIHIGQLEKMLDYIVPEASVINDGEEQVKLTLEEPTDEALDKKY